MLEDVGWDNNHVWSRWTCGGGRFRTRVTFPEEVALATVKKQRLGGGMVDHLAIAIGLFQFNECVNYAPDEIAIESGLAAQVPSSLLDLWDTVCDKVWAQWRWENELAGYRHPRLGTGTSSIATSESGPDSSGALVMYGGGKDSLLTYMVAREAGILSCTMSVSFSEYGDPGPQQRLISYSMRGLPGSPSSVAVDVEDSFWGSDEWTRTRPAGINTRTSAETPLSAFLAVPVAMTKRCDTILFGHESSADVPNLHWDEEGGEAVNHQWGKSQAAEALLNSYIRSNFGVGVASGLAGVSEVAIFKALNQFSEHVPRTHSCNVKKPWCLKCPKCCYVYLGMAAALEPDVARAVFGGANPLDDADNLHHYAQLLGIESRTPFECVGSVNDSQQLLRLGLRENRLSGGVLDELIRRGVLTIPVHEDGPISFSKLRGPNNVQEAVLSLFST